MLILRFLYLLLPYVACGIVGYFVCSLIPAVDPKIFGTITSVIGAVFALIDSIFWKTVDGTHEHIASEALSSREAIDLRRCISRRTKFLKQRWCYSFVVYIGVFLVGLIAIAKPDIVHLWPKTPCLLVGFLLTTIPAIASFIWARFDLIEFKSDLELKIRQHRDITKALEK